MIALGYANSSDIAAITPVDGKDTTYNIVFNYIEGMNYTNACQLKIEFNKKTGNIGLKSLSSN